MTPLTTSNNVEHIEDVSHEDSGATEEPDEAMPEQETEDLITPLPEEGAPPERGALPERGAQDVEAPRYHLRDRHVRTDRLRDAMDAPHNRQTYDPPVQLLQQNFGRPVQLLHQGFDSQCKYIFGWVMTQMTARAGLKKHGKFAQMALLKEFTQQRDLDVYEILDPLGLTHEEKMMALRALNLIKEKRNGDLKGRTVADGSKQKGLYPKSETASPAVSTAALMLTILIDAYERSNCRCRRSVSQGYDEGPRYY
jgi:hypothetical protein